MRSSGGTRSALFVSLCCLVACSGEGEVTTTSVGSTSSGVNAGETVSTNESAATADSTANTSAASSTTSSTTTSGGNQATNTGTSNASSTSSSSGAGGTTSASTGGESSSSGGSTNGTNGTTGTALVCEDDGTSQEPGSCATTVDSSCCALCIAAYCCSEFETCFASPTTVCGGNDETDSEFSVIQACMLDIDGGSVPSDIDDCVSEATNEVSGPACGLGSISDATNQLLGCMLDDSNETGGCFFECFDSTFDSGACLY